MLDLYVTTDCYSELIVSRSWLQSGRLAREFIIFFVICILTFYLLYPLQNIDVYAILCYSKHFKRLNNINLIQRFYISINSLKNNIFLQKENNNDKIANNEEYFFKTIVLFL
jgi:hypothetical protein